MTSVFPGVCRASGEIAFRVTCVPPTATHHHKKIITLRTKGGREFHKLGDKSELKDAKATIDSLLLPHQPKAPIVGLVRLTFVFEWPWRSSDPKRVRALGRVRKGTKPDCSNLAKTLEDRLVALRFIEDDAPVAELVVRKWWSDTPGISVRIESLTA